MIHVIADHHDLTGTPIEKITAPGAPKLYPAFRGHIDLYHFVGHGNAVHSIYEA